MTKKLDNLKKQAELRKEAEALINQMFDAGMTIDEVIEELSSLANKIDFKRFQKEQRGLSFEEWRQKDNAGWYVSKEAPEDVFERYLDYLKENNFSYDKLNPTKEKER